MLTKEYITELKINGNGKIAELIRKYSDSNNLTFILESLGQLPKGFDGNFLQDLLMHKNASVRLWCVKTIGKLNNEEYIEILNKTAINDIDTNVRREAVSSIGRMRNKLGKKILFEILNDNDPKIVCQAIRGLLVFKDDKEVEDQLRPLINHQNEMVRTVIYKEFFAKKDNHSLQPHTESFDYLKNTIINGNTIDIMNHLYDESIHLTFTSPPYYNARDYSIYPSYSHYLAFLSEVFKQVYRITKEGRFLILNTSPIIIPRVSRSHSSKRYPIPFDIHPFLIDIGWEFIDDIIWMKPEASVKNRIGGFQQHRKPLGYKPNCITEYLMVYRKSTEKLLDWNIHQYDKDIVKESIVPEGYENTNVWKIDPCFDKIHSAVFPAELCKRVIQYYSYKGDLVFDPFGGSGTVGTTAEILDRYFFINELDPVYFEYMKSKSNQHAMFKKRQTQFLTFNQFKEIIK
jgi:DNA modification methylase